MWQLQRGARSQRNAHVGSGVPVMPAGALGIWNAQDYSAAPRAVIPNKVAATPVSANILPFSTNLSYNPMNAGADVAVTNRYANGPSGSTNTALRAVGTPGNCYLALNLNGLPAGTYTLAADYKSNTGSSQTFRMGSYFRSPALKTATTSWQRFSTQFTTTITGEQYICWAVSPDGSAGFDLLIDNIQIFAGGVDLGADTIAGHAYFELDGSAPLATNPSPGILDVSAGSSAILQVPATSMAAFTIGGVYRRTSASDNGYNSLFTDPVGGFASFGIFTNQGGLTACNSNVQSALNWDKNGAGWRLFAYTYDGTTLSLFLNNRCIWARPASLSAVTIDTLLMFAVNGFGQYTTPYQMNAMFVYPTALSLSDMRTKLYPAVVAKAAENSIALSASRTLTAEGDSITAGAGGTPYESQFVANASQAFDGMTIAVSGSTTADAVTRAALMGPATGSGKDIWTILMGANDVGGYAGASDTIAAQNWCNAMFALTDERRSAGYIVGVATVLPIGSAPTHNARRNIANPLLRAAVGTHIDFIIDFDTDAQMGIDTAAADYPANWADTIHPSATGHARLEPIYRAAVNAQLDLI